MQVTYCARVAARIVNSGVRGIPSIVYGGSAPTEEGAMRNLQEKLSFAGVTAGGRSYEVLGVVEVFQVDPDDVTESGSSDMAFLRHTKYPERIAA